MKISARNQTAGRVVAIQPGAVNGSVKVNIDSDIVKTASITGEAITDLGLGIGDDVNVFDQGKRRADRQIACAPGKRD